MYGDFTWVRIMDDYLDRVQRHAIHCHESENVYQLLQEYNRLKDYVKELESTVRYLELQNSKTL